MLCLKMRIFLGKGPSQGQTPGLLGHGSKIPSLSCDSYRYIVLSLHSKFQLSRCRNDEKKSYRWTDGHTDDSTKSIVNIFEKCALNKTSAPTSQFWNFFILNLCSFHFLLATYGI
jgi:hypothetical protein